MGRMRTIKGTAKAIAGFFREQRRMPTYAGMTVLLGVRSKSVVHFWVQKLIAAGLLEKDPRGFLRLPHRGFTIPMVGKITAGFFSPAEEELRDTISFDEYLVPRPEASFLLKVSGDSMIGAGIRQGDVVVVERGREPKSGDIILAEVDGAWTMKYFRKKGKDIFLESANSAYPPIRPETELKVGGVVRAVIRKYP
jgi:repressor LexA